MQSVYNLTYPVHRAVVIPNTTDIVVFAGIFFPSSKKIIRAEISFGDTSQVYSLLRIDDINRLSIISSLSGIEGFFPRWTESREDDISAFVPKFYVNYNYSTPGDYDITCTLIDEVGNRYIGSKSVVRIPNPQLNIGVDPWSELSKDYTPTNDILILQGIETGTSTSAIPSTPTITRTIRSDSSLDNLPFVIEYNVLNIRDRNDIDYIHWVFNNGVTVTQNVRLDKTTYGAVLPMYQWWFTLPRSNNLEAYAILAIRTPTGQLYQYPLENIIPLNAIGNIAVSRDDAGTETDISASVVIDNNETVLSNVSDQYTFCITPGKSYKLPLFAQFYFNLGKNNVAFILCNYDDGSYDIIPVINDALISSATEYFAYTGHRYTSLNHKNFLPRFIFIYQDKDGNYAAQKIVSRQRLQYDYGIINQNENHKLGVVYGTSNFRKFNSISTAFEYLPGTGYVNIWVRLAIGADSRHVLYFDKIVWNFYVNGVITEIVQAKDLSETFGQTFFNFFVPSTSKGLITATVYKYNNKTLLDEVYDVYITDTFDILDEYSSLVQNYTLSLLTQQRPIINTEIMEDSEDDAGPLPDVFTKDIENQEYEASLSDNLIFEGNDIKFDRLFKAENPAANFLNRNNPSIASTPSNNYVDRYEIGYFRPQQTNFTVLDPGLFTFTIDQNIESKKIYYLPDPYKYGSYSPAINFYIDVDTFKSGVFYGVGGNFPYVRDPSISSHGYRSLNKNTISYNTETDAVSGYIFDFKDDIFGNNYALLKRDSSFNKSPISPTTNDNTYYINVNGYKFYDIVFNQGFSYDYYVESTYKTETFRSNLSTFTGSFSSGAPSVFLNFNGFERKDFIKQQYPTDITTQFITPLKSEINSCEFFINGIYADSPLEFMSSDLNSFPGNQNQYYYTALYDAGAHSLYPYKRALRDNTSAITKAQSAVFTVTPQLSNNTDVLDIDGGHFFTQYTDGEPSTIYSNTPYIFDLDITSSQTTINTTFTQKDTLFNRYESQGHLYVKTTNNNISAFQQIFSFIKTKYGTTIFNELSNIKGFDIYLDTFFLQTENTLIIDKIKYDKGEIINPSTKNIYLTYNTDLYQKITNRFNVGNKVYFAILQRLDAMFVPAIYEYDYTLHTLKEIFLNSTSYSTAIANKYLTVSTTSPLVEIWSPRITYIEKYDMFCLTLVCKDQNKTPTIINHMFRITDLVEWVSVDIFPFNSSTRGTEFITNYSSLAFHLTSSTPANPTPAQSFLLL